ncbi:MAG: type II secretion system protein N [Usitatibacter sp.]
MRFTFAVIGTAAYAAFLVALMPASFVAKQAEAQTRGGLQVHEASGTIWKGGGRATVATPAGPLAIERFTWRFLPSRLASGRVGFQVEGVSSGFTGRGEVGRALATWEARDVAVAGDARGIGSFLPLLAHWRPEGTLSMDAPRLAWDEREMRGEAKLEWRAAAMALSEVRPLGSYRVEVRGDGGPAKITLQTLEGALRLSGHGTLAPPSRLTFSGEARGEAAHAAKLAPLLDLMGPPRADGSRSLEWRIP